MGEPTSNKLEIPKSVHALPAFQDGGFAMFSKHSKEQRLHMQTGFEQCMIFSSIKLCIQKVCSISLVRETLQVSLLLFWIRPSTKNLYKITQNSSFSVMSTEHTNYKLLGRHVTTNYLAYPYNRRNVYAQRQLGFVLNLRKSILTPTQRTKF